MSYVIYIKTQCVSFIVQEKRSSFFCNTLMRFGWCFELTSVLDEYCFLCLDTLHQWLVTDLSRFSRYCKEHSENILNYSVELQVQNFIHKMIQQQEILVWKTFHWYNSDSLPKIKYSVIIYTPLCRLYSFKPLWVSFFMEHKRRYFEYCADGSLPFNSNNCGLWLSSLKNSPQVFWSIW